MKITMQAIADMAGVSRATVDKVIHNRPGVSHVVREKIKNLILETNYQPIHIHTLQNNTAQVKIAVIMPELQEYFMHNIKAGMDASYLEYKPSGFEVDYYYCNSYDPQSLIAILQHLKNTPIDGIALRGISHEKIYDLISDFADNNIPTFTFDADLPESRRISFVGEDLYMTGRIGASLLCKSIGYEGQIAVLVGGINVTTSTKRLQGFRSYIEEFAPKVQIVAIEETLTQQMITYQKTTQLLNRFPNLKGMWNAVGHSEQMAQAVIDADKKQKVRLGSLIFTPEIMRLIKEGVIDHTIGLTPYKMGKIVIKLLYEYIISNIVPPEENVKTPIYIGIDANIDMFIAHPFKDFDF